MTGKNTDPEIIFSKLCQTLMVDGHRFKIIIVSSDQSPEWCLEVIDENSMPHCWGPTFETDAEALEAAMLAFEEEGAEGFLQPATNVVEFPSTFASKGADQ